MILNTTHLNERMSVDIQTREIERIKSAPYGTELYSVPTDSNTDVIDTLLHLSKVSYHVGVAGKTAKYYKV